MFRAVRLMHTDDYEDDQNQKAIFEKFLEDSLVENFNDIFEGRYIYLTRQYPIIERGDTVGIIDILALNTTNNSIVAVELKKDHAEREVCGQISAYMGWLKSHVGQIIQEFKVLQDGNKYRDIEGIIICGMPDIRLYWATIAHNNLSLYAYGFDVFNQILGLTKYVKLNGNSGLNLKLPEKVIEQSDLIDNLDKGFNQK